MHKKFDMTGLWILHYFLNVEIRYNQETLLLSQQKYVNGLLNKFRLIDCSLATTPMEHGTRLTKFNLETDLDTGL